jgi:hypothetical protein
VFLCFRCIREQGREHRQATRVWAGSVTLGAGVDEGHQPADLPGQADPSEEVDKTDQFAERGDRLGGRVGLVGREIPPEDRKQSASILRALFVNSVRSSKAIPVGLLWWLVKTNAVSLGLHLADNPAYRGLDHTVLFRDAFLTCPYNGENREIESVSKLKPHYPYKIEAELLDMKFSSSGSEASIGAM